MSALHPEIPSRVHLYDGVRGDFLKIEEIKRYILDQVPTLSVEVGADPVAGCAGPGGDADEEGNDSLARRFARCKVIDTSRPLPEREPLHGEIEYEKRRIRAGGAKSPGLVYDGEWLQEIYRELIPREESGLSHLHIIFTSRLFATFDEFDRRYHARVVLLGAPSLVSTAGAVEAPAKPREFYILRDRYGSLAQRDLVTAELKEQFRGRFLDYGDERTTDVLKGYALQALFYRIFGEAFCEEKSCKLYNAHWQEEMIEAQLRPGAGLCRRHRGMLSSVAKAR